jgi:hypothetical protein
MSWFHLACRMVSRVREEPEQIAQNVSLFNQLMITCCQVHLRLLARDMTGPELHLHSVFFSLLTMYLRVQQLQQPSGDSGCETPGYSVSN